MNKEYKELQCNVIDFLRFPLAVMVVFLHNGINVQQIVWTEISLCQLNSIIRVAGSHVFTHVAVPLFFLLSGYLFFVGLTNWNYMVWKRKIKSRFVTLVVPYILWNVIAMFIEFSEKCTSVFLKGYKEYSSDIWNWLVINFDVKSLWCSGTWNSDRLNWLAMEVPSSAPFLSPLWFIRDLILMTFLTPLIYMLIKRGGVFCNCSSFSKLYISGLAVLPRF